MAGISKKTIKTKNKTVIKYTITYRDVFGKQHTSGLYSTLKDAKRDLLKFESTNNNEKNITMGKIFNDFLQKAHLKYSPSTYEIYELYYNKYLKLLDSIKYSKVDSIQIQDFFNRLEKNTTPNVAKHCLKISRAAFNYAKKHKIIKYNIFNDIDNISVPKPDINHLTVEELINLLNECKKSYPHYYALLYVFIGTGAREGEIFALTKNDFIKEERCLLINKQYTQRKLIHNTKTESSNRKVYLFDELFETLEKYIETLTNDSILLFPNKKGGYIDAHNFRKRVFYKLLKLCGITKRVRLHDLRGSYIDMVLSSGLSCKFAQSQVGHARSETTLNIYARNNSDMIKSANQKLNSIFSTSRKCENNVRIAKNNKKSNVIKFPENACRTRK